MGGAHNIYLSIYFLWVLGDHVHGKRCLCMNKNKKQRNKNGLIFPVCVLFELSDYASFRFTDLTCKITLGDNNHRTIFPHLCERHDAHMGVPVHVAPRADAVVTQEGVHGQRDAAVCVLDSRLVFVPVRYGQVWSEDFGHQNELYEAHAAHKQLSPQCRYRQDTVPTLQPRLQQEGAVVQHHVTSCRALPLVVGNRLHQRMRVQPEEATEHAPDDVWEETQDGGHA